MNARSSQYDQRRNILLGNRELVPSGQVFRLQQGHHAVDDASLLAAGKLVRAGQDRLDGLLVRGFQSPEQCQRLRWHPGGCRGGEDAVKEWMWLSLSKQNGCAYYITNEAK